MKISPQENIKSSHRCKKGFYRGYQMIDRLTGNKLVDVRFYQPQATVYCCLWVHAGDVHASGSGKAGGCGYHKPSAAMEMAFFKAGISDFKPFNGCGDAAEREALQELASVLGFADAILVEFYE